MCIKCLEAAKRHFPDCPEDKIHELLMGGTCFPFGEPEQVEKQLIEAKEAGCQNWFEVLDYADMQLDQAMNDMRTKERLLIEITDHAIAIAEKKEGGNDGLQGAVAAVRGPKNPDLRGRRATREAE